MLGIASGLMLANKVSEGPIVAQNDGNYLSVGVGAGNGLELVPFQSTLRGSFTFACWLALGDIENTLGSTIIFGGKRTAGSVTENLAFSILNDGKIQIVFEANNDPTVVKSASGILSGTNVGLHNHLAFVVTKNSGSDTTFTVYINGDAVTMASPSGTISETNHNQYTSAENLHLGAYAIADGAPLSNDRVLLIKHAALWNSALNAANVDELWDMGHGDSVSPSHTTHLGNEAHASGPIDLTSASGNYDTQGDLVGYWKLTEGGGTIANDSSGNGNNGTVVGAITHLV